MSTPTEWWHPDRCKGCHSAKQILDQAGVPIFVVDQTGDFVYINQATLLLIGSPSLKQSMEFNAFTLPSAKEVGLDALLRRGLQGERVNTELDYLSMWGKPAPIRISVVPILDKGKDEPVAVGCVITPLAEQKEKDNKIKELIEEVAAAKLEQREMDRLRNQFMAIVSHEFRTPLVPLTGYLQMLDEQRLGELNERQAKAVQVAYRNTQRLLELVEKVLMMTSDGQPAPPDSLQSVPMGTLVREAVDTMHPVLRERELQVETQWETPVPPALCDQARLHRILITLLDNARKFGAHGGRVLVWVGPVDNGRVAIEVANTGPSIPRKERLRIFEPFYQVENPLTRTHGGMGLGLAIVRDSVLALHGAVEVVDRPGYDATFRVTLLRADSTAWLASNRQERERITFRALLVDHAPERRLLLRDLLTAHKFEITEATVDEAMRSFVKHAPNLVLLGLDDPDGRAQAVVHGIRTGQRGRLTPIIAVTANSDPTQKRADMDNGATAVVVEPLDEEWLRQLLNSIHSISF